MVLSHHIFQNIYLAGGLEHVLFSPIVGMMIESDFHCSGVAKNHQPDSLLLQKKHHFPMVNSMVNPFILGSITHRIHGAGIYANMTGVY